MWLQCTPRMTQPSHPVRCLHGAGAGVVGAFRWGDRGYDRTLGASEVHAALDAPVRPPVAPPSGAGDAQAPLTAGRRRRPARRIRPSASSEEVPGSGTTVTEEPKSCTGS